MSSPLDRPPRRPVAAARFAPFGTTIFSEMTALSQRVGAINLAQGFPDFDGPQAVRDAACAAIAAGHNQYARSLGHPALVAAVARKVARHYGIDVDPMTQVGVYSGATEGLAAAILGLVDPGDEVILFEPFYDSYRACVAMAGARARLCTLRAPGFSFDPDELARCFGPRTRLLLLNTPHNPTGRVFRRDELQVIADLCAAHDVIVLTDEVYEHIVFDGARHVPLATLPGMFERTLTLSSTGKTFSLTGWKVGYAVGPAPLVQAAQAAHQFITFATATPLQVGLASALDGDDAYYATLAVEYTQRRQVLLDALRGAGLSPYVPEGAYFALVDISALGLGDDRAFARHLTEQVGVACIPTSVFYEDAVEEGRRLVRFAFCKRIETLEAAAERLVRLR